MYRIKSIRIKSKYLIYVVMQEILIFFKKITQTATLKFLKFVNSVFFTTTPFYKNNNTVLIRFMQFMVTRGHPENVQ